MIYFVTTSVKNDRYALKLHYANKHPTSRKAFEKVYSITFTGQQATI